MNTIQMELDMKTVFFGSLYIFHNSIEGGVKYFTTPTYQSLLGDMIKYLADEKYIQPDMYELSYSNSIDFITDGNSSSITVGGETGEGVLEDLLSDISSDNINTPGGEMGWIAYEAHRGGVIEDKSLIMTVCFNENYNEVGYHRYYHTLVGKSEDELRSRFVLWAYENFGVGEERLPNHIEKTIKLLNDRYYEDYTHDKSGLDMHYRIETVLGDRVSGEAII